MKVAICTTNQSIMINLVSMVAKDGCKFTKVQNYSMNSIKSNDICILDLDNLKDYYNKIKEDLPLMQEILFIGISRNSDVLDIFRPLINVEQKPFSKDTFNHYKDMIKETTKSDLIINKDSDRIYNNLGVSLNSLLDEDILTKTDKEQLLYKKIEKAKTYIKSEEEFITDIGLSTVKMPEFEEITSFVIDETFFEDIALNMYRKSKLRKMNLTISEINNKIDLLNNKFKKENITKETKSISVIDKFKEKKIQEEKRQQALLQQKQKQLTVQTEVNTEPISNEIEEPLDEIDKKYLMESESEIEKANINIPSESDNKSENLQILDVKLTPEQEALINNRLRNLRKQPPKPKPKPKPKPQEQIQPEINISNETVISESVPKVEIPIKSDEKEQELEKILKEADKVLDRLNTSNHSPNKNKPKKEVIEHNSNNDLMKQLPNNSLLSLLKDKMVTEMPVTNSRKDRKKELERKIKPPRR